MQFFETETQLGLLNHYSIPRLVQDTSHVLSHHYIQSILNGHMHSQTYGRVDACVHEKVLVLFQESLMRLQFSCTYAIFCWIFSQEVRVGPIKLKLPYRASTCY